MRLGIGSRTYPWAVGLPDSAPPPQPMTAWRLIGRAAALGLHVVQICDNLPLDRLSVGALPTLAEQASRHGIHLEVGTRGLTIPHLRVQVRLAEKIGAELLRVAIDTTDHHPTKDEVLRLLGETLPECEQIGVPLGSFVELGVQAMQGIDEELGL